jgi:hypothetical protein
MFLTSYKDVILAYLLRFGIERRTAMVRNNVIASFYLSVVVLACVALTAGDAVAGGEGSEMARNFDKVRIGMNAADTEKIMGPPSKTLKGREGEYWTRAYVWEKRKRIISKETAIAVFDGDRAVMLFHTVGGLDDIRKEINRVPQKPVDYPSGIEVATSAELDSWAEVSYMLARLYERSDGNPPVLDAQTSASFDEIKLDTGEDDLVKLLGEPTGHNSKSTKSIYTWEHNGEKLVVVFENGALVEKSLETRDFEFNVREGYWSARNKDSGDRIVVQL